MGRRRRSTVKSPAKAVDAPALTMRQRHRLELLPARGDLNVAKEAHALRTAFEQPNAWTPFLEAYTTQADVEHVWSVAQQINPDRADEIAVRFFRTMIETRASQPHHVTEMYEGLPRDWYTDPIYYAYVQHFGVPREGGAATFDSLIGQLDYLEELGIRNVFLLPHYESPGGDGGYDVSRFEPAEALGGKAAYERFMEVAVARGFRVMTDIPANHISTRHEKFQRLLRGELSLLDHFVTVDGARLLVKDPVEGEDGRPRYIIQHPDGETSVVWRIFEATDHPWIDVEVQGEQGPQTHQLFHSFYPFQLDVNLRHPEVLEELLQLLGSEANVGNVGKRMDAAPHWFKEPGTNFENLEGTHALQALFKSFLFHVVPKKGVTLPEVSFPQPEKYYGEPTELLGVRTTSEGDGLFDFQMKPTLLATLLTGDVEHYWRTLDERAEVPDTAQPLNILGHHDEWFLKGKLPPELLESVNQILLDAGAAPFADRGFSIRAGDALGGAPERIAASLFLLYMTPGVPVIYFGDEIGWRDNAEFEASEQRRRHAILNDLGCETTLDGARDTRDRQRGGIPAEAFMQKLEARYAAVELLPALNALRDRVPALKSATLQRLTVAEPGVFAGVRSAEGQPAVVALENLSAERRTITLSRAELEPHLGSLEGGPVLDLLGTEIRSRRGDDHPARVAVRARGDAIELELGPFERLLLAADA
ncbi:MAG: hypothetical protein H6730_33835 [Deltaproteobacteria bacterium]|nr:hypothetical protein [Deltaproteobacteria bacterium]